MYMGGPFDGVPCGIPVSNPTGEQAKVMRECPQGSRAILCLSDPGDPFYYLYEHVERDCIFCGETDSPAYAREWADSLSNR